MGERIVIAGAGLAGLRAAQAARQAGHTGELVLLGAEPHPPYTRPPLSKELLRGESDATAVAFPGLDKLDATVRLASVVTGIDPAGRTVSLAGDDQLAYDRLIVATGAAARPLSGVPVADGVHTLRGLDDAHALRDALADADHLAVVGAGFVGCEVAASAVARGIAVTLVDAAPAPLAPLGAELGARVAALHAEHGVVLHLGAAVARVDADAVVLADHTVIGADVVLLAVGARPSTDFLRDSGIELAPDGGVVCDATLTSVSDPDVLAAGDVAAWPHPGAGEEWVRVEHWTTAAEHGRIAGANATHEPAQRTAHVAPPYFWSDLYDVKIQSVGFPARAARIEIVDEAPADDGTPRLVAEAHDAAGELVGAVTFNHARRLAEYRRALAVQHA